MSAPIYICAGIDPQFNPVDPFFRQQEASFGSRSFLLKYAKTIISAIADDAQYVKFQSAYFEARGSEGILAMREAMAEAKVRGLHVILDAKRGDIGSTMTAYGEFAFEYMNADSLTVNPYVGRSAVDGISSWLESGRECFLVLLTSSGKGDPFQEGIKQDLELGSSWMSDFLLQFESLPFRGQIGLVVGANRIDGLSPALFGRLRKFRWLVPGIGAQGGTMSRRLQDSHDGAPVIIPVSREICGDIGIAGLSRNLKASNWQEYEEFVRSNLKDFLERIST